MTADTRTVHPVDEKLPPLQTILYALQHVLSMYSGVVAVPLVMGGALKLSTTDTIYLTSAALFMSGVATLFQTLGVWRIGARQPIVQGTSFVAVSSMITIGMSNGAGHGNGHGALQAIYGSLIAAGLIGFVLAPVFTRLLHLFPDVVTGAIITMIGLSLIPVAVGWVTGTGDGTAAAPPKQAALAFITLAIIIAVYRLGPPALSRVAILVGLVLGTLVAIPMGLTNFSTISKASVFQVPAPFHFGTPTFQFGAIISMTICVLVIMTEATADILALGEVIERPADRDTVTNGLRADTLSTALAGVFNGFSLSAFAQNVGLVAITGIRSRFVVAAGGLILVLLGLFPVVGAIIAVVPMAVLGGAGLVLFGTVAASGVRTLATVDYEGNNNIIIVAVALTMGVAPVVDGKLWTQFPDWFQTIFNSGITACAVTAVVLNVVFNVLGRRGDPTEENPFSRGPAWGAISDADENRITP